MYIYVHIYEVNSRYRSFVHLESIEQGSFGESVLAATIRNIDIAAACDTRQSIACRPNVPAVRLFIQRAQLAASCVPVCTESRKTSKGMGSVSCRGGNLAERQIHKRVGSSCTKLQTLGKTHAKINLSDDNFLYFIYATSNFLTPPLRAQGAD